MGVALGCFGGVRMGLWKVKTSRVMFQGSVPSLGPGVVLNEPAACPECPSTVLSSVCLNQWPLQ
jgi:hypothetical protein